MSVRNTLKAKWLWYSVFCLACWAPFTFCAKLGLREMSASGMQFLFTLGGVPIALAVLAARRFKFERNRKGTAYGLAVGVLSAIGTLALFAAYRTGGNTAVITTATSLYPMVTVVLAVGFLRERLTLIQIVGLVFASVAFVLFSL
ncbi:MAG: DMT family transporter [Terriglobia bacterium]|jgi:uncharacterized membrane protein